MRPRIQIDTRSKLRYLKFSGNNPLSTYIAFTRLFISKDFEVQGREVVYFPHVTDKKIAADIAHVNRRIELEKKKIQKTKNGK